MATFEALDQEIVPDCCAERVRRELWQFRGASGDRVARCISQTDRKVFALARYERKALRFMSDSIGFVMDTRQLRITSGVIGQIFFAASDLLTP